jgi:hypothetical protein
MSHLPPPLQPDNLLLAADFGLRVCDFGLSILSTDVASATLRTNCGTVCLCACCTQFPLAGNACIDISAGRVQSPRDLARRALFRSSRYMVGCSGALHHDRRPETVRVS